MGKSAKFYKRPTRKEKQAKALSKLVDSTSGVSKKGNKKKTTEKAAAAAAAAAVAATSSTPSNSDSMDVDMPVTKKKNSTKPKEDDKPDYVDLLTGQRTYKKVPPKRK